MKPAISRWWSLMIVSAAALLSVIDIFIVNVAIPAIQKGVHGTNGEMQLVIAVYLLGYACFLITAGRMGDYYGRKKMFVIGMAAFTVTSCLCGLAPTAFFLNTARFFQGVSASLMVPQAVSYIQVLFPEREARIKAVGIYGIIAGSASVIGQFLGGLLPDTHVGVEGWRLLFFINLPPGIIALVAAVIYLRETPQNRTQQFDYGGVALLSPALGGLIYPLIQGREMGWPWWSIACILLSAGLFVVFLFDQHRKSKQNRAPLIDARLFRYRDFNIGMITVLFYFMVQDAYFLVSAILLQTGLAVSTHTTGLYFVCQGIGYVIASVLSVKLINRYGKKVLQAGALIMIVTLLLHIVLLSTPTPDRTSLLLVLFGYGVGCGSVLPSLLTMSLKSIPHAYAGAASGTYFTFQQFAVALGVGVVGGIFFYLLGPAPAQQQYILAYRYTTLFNIILLILVSTCLIFLPDPRQPAATVTDNA